MAKQKTPGNKKPVTKSDDEDQETPGEDDTESDDEDSDNAEAENRRINAIVTSRVKREMKPLLSMMTQLQETIKAQAAKKPEESQDDDTDDGDESSDSKKPVVDTKMSKKMARIEAQLAEERTARKKAEQERAEEQERGKTTEMRTIFDSALTEHGVSDPVLRRSALREIEAQGYMVRDEDGKIKFKGTDKWGVETLFDPKTGLKDWVTKEGKSFIPAVDAGGSGTGGSRGTGNGDPLTNKQFNKLSDQQRASINLERACAGLPALGEGQ